MRYYYKYFEGPKTLPTIDFLLIAQCGNNDLHLITYCPASEMQNHDCLKKMKLFRQMNQQNENNTFHYQYWVIEDEAMAKQLGIDTDKNQVGDLHLVRKCSAFTNGLQSNIRLGGYKYVSE